MALDTLQGEDNCYYGSLLPTLEILMSKTLALQNGLSGTTAGLHNVILQVCLFYRVNLKSKSIVLFHVIFIFIVTPEICNSYSLIHMMNPTEYIKYYTVKITLHIAKLSLSLFLNYICKPSRLDLHRCWTVKMLYLLL